MADPGEKPLYSTANAMWPDLREGRVTLNPPRNGMDRYTGKMLSGWDHVEQSMSIMFATPFHERVLRRWVGTFVPHILGQSGVARVITRFFWAIATAIELWEPCYRVRQVFFMGDALQGMTPTPQLTEESASDRLRVGHAIFRTEGAFFPRGHLGDYDTVAGRPASIPITGELSG